MAKRGPILTKSEWAKRRFRLDIALITILVLVVWIVFSGTDSVLYQQTVIALIGAGVALLGQYIFGAVWDDKNYMQAVKSIKETQPDYYSSGYVDHYPSQVPNDPKNLNSEE